MFSQNLKKLQSPYHNQEARATIKSLPPSISNNIEEDLKEMGLTTIQVRQLFKTEFKEGNIISTLIPVWILTIDKESADTELLDNLKEILYTKVRVKAYKRLTGIIQCYRCQQFRHFAQNCRRVEKCV